MMRRAFCGVLLVAAAAIAALGCGGSSKLLQGALLNPGNVVILTDEDDDGRKACDVVVGKKVVIDDPAGSGLADEVTWIRPFDTSGEVHFKLKNQNDKSLFPEFEKPMKDGESKKKSGKPQQSTSAGYIVGYEIRWKGKDCDPEICIRKSGSGCDGYLEAE